MCAGGLGDGLLMMITAQGLREAGKDVVVFHNLHGLLAPLFPHATFKSYPQNLLEELEKYDHVVVQNDNSRRAWTIMRARDKLKKCTFFYPTPTKMAVNGDYVFPRRTPIGESIANATASLLSLRKVSMENGIAKPSGVKRKNKTRIVIHPTSADPKRNWSQRQFLALACTLERKGYEIAFIMAKEEQDGWIVAKEYGFLLPQFPTLKEAADFIYESGYFIGNDSGLGHLASNLGIPTLTISGNPKRVALWRPSWTEGHIATLRFDLPNFKGIRFRFREHFWQYFLPVRRVVKQFLELAHET